NGTLIASSSNLVCIGVAEQHGYKFNFVKFMKIGFPLLLTNGFVASMYLIVFNVLPKWY
ncbi:P protein, partial [Pseudolycoriella hygida]